MAKSRARSRSFNWKSFFAGLAVIITPLGVVVVNYQAARVNSKVEHQTVQQDTTAIRDSLSQARQMAWSKKRDSIAIAANKRFDNIDTTLARQDLKYEARFDSIINLILTKK